MPDVSLTAAVRDSLLSLQNTTKLIEKTQGRLSTGLAVAGPTDDPVAYFQSKGLNDRAFDFTEKKKGVDQAVSTVSAALDGVDAIESIVRQMKGLLNSMKSATTSQMADLISQFTDLRDQINLLATDTTYQGSNLINGTGVTLDVEFSNLTSSKLTVKSVDLTNGTAGLDINTLVNYTSGTMAVKYASAKHKDTGAGNVLMATGGLSAGSTLTVTWVGPAGTYASGSSLTFSYGTNTLTVKAKDGQTFSANEVLTLNIGSTATTGLNIQATQKIGFSVSFGAGSAAYTTAKFSGFTYTGPTATYTSADKATFSYGTHSVIVSFTSNTVLSQGETFIIYNNSSTAKAGAYAATGFTAIGGTGGTAGTFATAAGAGNTLGVLLGSTTGYNDSQTYVKAGGTDAINTLLKDLDSALSTLRTQAQSLGTNVALLKTRLDFTETYVNTLTAGASKLTLANINEEGANLLALQTRQQLGIQSLSFAGQAEQSILSLFR